MQTPRRTSFALLSLAALVLSAAPLHADAANGFGGNPFSPVSPRVPVSSLARPAAWFDPSRLHFAQTFSMGTGYGGASTGLSVTSFMYQFAAPLTMSVNLGSTFGAGSRDGSSFFLEGVNLQYRPSANSLIQFEYHDVRSPLQLQNRSPYYNSGPWGY